MQPAAVHRSCGLAPASRPIATNRAGHLTWTAIPLVVSYVTTAPFKPTGSHIARSGYLKGLCFFITDAAPQQGPWQSSAACRAAP